MRRTDEEVTGSRTQIGSDLKEQTLRLDQARLPRTDVARVDQSAPQAHADSRGLLNEPGLLRASQTQGHRPEQLGVALPSVGEDLSDGRDRLNLDDNVLNVSSSRRDRRKGPRRSTVSGLSLIQEGQFDLDPPKIL